MRSLEELPLFLTIEEAAEILRISRWAAYEQARIWRETGGLRGLRVVTLGRCLRVPRSVIEQLLRPGAGIDSPDASIDVSHLRAIP